jgi:uncharacterized RDD family membrane protein YckC
LSRSTVFTWRSAEREGQQRELVTPEGVPLRFAVAAGGDRVVAFAIDLVIIVGSVFVLVLIAALAASFAGGWAEAVFLFALFVLRNFYFTLFELHWQGSTPGKRVVGIRVMDGHGGALRSDSIIVRNLTREIEVFLPLVILLAPESVGLEPGWTYVVSGLWLLIFALFPLFNRDRLRIGDLIAGTLVVRAPRTALMPELSRSRLERSPALSFTDQQLDLYGVYELQVLEDLLRQTDPDRKTLRAVVTKIQRKIAWRGATNFDARTFLTAFYEAQRAHLERKLLLGKARERKQEGRLKRSRRLRKRGGSVEDRG